MGSRFPHGVPPHHSLPQEEKKRAMMNKKCHELVDRAERIKEFLKPDGTKPPAPSPAPGPQPPGGAAPGTVRCVAVLCVCVVCGLGWGGVG